MTLKEIASALNVSPSTVSRVLNDPHSKAAGPELQEKIRRFARANNYTPNLAAKRLRSGIDAAEQTRPKRIYGIIPTAPDEAETDAFYSTLVSALEAEAIRHNCTFEVTMAGHLQENSAFFSGDPGDTAGLIIIGRFTPDFFRLMRQQFQNIVYICMNNMDADCDGIICDGYYIAQDAVNYLISLGHSRIGFLGAIDDSRLTGFLDAMEENSLPVNKDYCIHSTRFCEEGGYQAMREILRKKADITAVYCVNDMVALGALRACLESGVDVPGDISILGSVGTDIAKSAKPPISTIEAPLEEMAQMATKLLLEDFYHPRKSHIKMFFQTTLAQRSTCRPLQQKQAAAAQRKNKMKP